MSMVPLHTSVIETEWHLMRTMGKSRPIWSLMLNMMAGIRTGAKRWATNRYYCRQHLLFCHISEGTMLNAVSGWSQKLRDMVHGRRVSLSIGRNSRKVYIISGSEFGELEDQCYEEIPLRHATKRKISNLLCQSWLMDLSRNRQTLLWTYSSLHGWSYSWTERA